MIKRVQGVCLLSSFRGGAKNGKRKYNRQVMLDAPRTLITPTYCQTDIQRQGKACSVGIRVWILSVFNPWRTASPELEQSWYWTAREKKKGMRKKRFLLGQLTACCCSTLPEAMQPQLHHLHWKGAREEGAAERATPPGSSPVMAVPGCEFT